MKFIIQDVKDEQGKVVEKGVVFVEVDVDPSTKGCRKASPQELDIWNRRHEFAAKSAKTSEVYEVPDDVLASDAPIEEAKKTRK